MRRRLPIELSVSSRIRLRSLAIRTTGRRRNTTIRRGSQRLRLQELPARGEEKREGDALAGALPASQWIRALVIRIILRPAYANGLMARTCRQEWDKLTLRWPWRVALQPHGQAAKSTRRGWAGRT